MKYYKTKFQRNDKVYSIINKKIMELEIQSIKIIESQPYIDGTTMQKNNGISIEYKCLVSLENETTFKWFKENVLYKNKKECLIN